MGNLGVPFTTYCSDGPWDASNRTEPKGKANMEQIRWIYIHKVDDFGIIWWLFLFHYSGCWCWLSLFYPMAHYI
jgi:hypothetical protein